MMSAINKVNNRNVKQSVEATNDCFMKSSSYNQVPPGRSTKMFFCLRCPCFVFPIAAVLAQSVKHLNAEREVAGLIPGAGPLLRALK